MEYYAHTDGTQNTKNWQPLREHLKNVAEMARDFAQAARPGAPDFAAAAHAAGLLHDLGKYRPEFQSMIRGLRPKGESTWHKQAGAAEAVRTKHKHFDICFSILGHHGGMPDKADLAEAVKSGTDVAGAVLSKALADCPELGDAACGEAVKLHGADFDLRTRLMFSCLVDADWLDTSDFHCRCQGRPRRQSAPALDAPGLLRNVLVCIADRAARCRSAHVAKIRAEVLTASLESAAGGPGIFSLTVPTGGGKTLSALAFALQHAAAHGLRRIIYVAPYLSIIEQNAAVFRAAIGEAADTLILEHHSMAEPGNDGPKQTDAPESDAALRLAENWDSPIVLTTSVQFYESLFSNQPSKCRKLHNIARSVVILDECQTVPPGLTAPTCEMLGQVSGYLGASIVLCTATQPAWKKDPDRLPAGIPEMREIMPDPADLFRRLKRVEVAWPSPAAAGLEWTEVAAKVAGHHQALCVVNTRHAATQIYQRLAELNCQAFHLSTNMCPAHRKQALARVTAELKAGKPCRLVSTQLVEAGVDLDFPLVMREMAPLESIVQAAGRCNREGLLNEAGRGRVIVFQSKEGKKPSSNWYKNGARIVEQNFLARGRQPRIDAPEDIAEYYRCLYPTGDLDSKAISDGRADYNFSRVARDYAIVDEATTPLVIAAWEAARQSVEDLLTEFRRHPSRELYRRFQMFTVNVYNHELRRLAGACVMNDPPGVNVCSLPYHGALGLEMGSAAVLPVF